jgi:hypothetical protein
MKKRDSKELMLKCGSDHDYRVVSDVFKETCNKNKAIMLSRYYNISVGYTF